jgi:hypothetical protein
MDLTYQWQELRGARHDNPSLVEFIKAVLGSAQCAKVGSKGLTIFCQLENSIESAKLRRRGESAPCVEIFAHTGMTVIPPSVHPSGAPYRGVGTPLPEIPHSELPVLTPEKIDVIRAVISNPHTWEIIEGLAGISGHRRCFH